MDKKYYDYNSEYNDLDMYGNYDEFIKSHRDEETRAHIKKKKWQKLPTF